MTTEPTMPATIQPSAPLFDKEAYGRFKMPQLIGETISGWDDPVMAPASEASHMREDDYVVGLVFRGRPRAYPLWIIDHYHVVNDRVAGRRFVVASCERCQSGAAYEAAVKGNPEREPLFRSVGFLNATLLLKDLRTGSHWIHYEGLGLDRRAAGTRLPWIPTFHMEWADWVALHPDTEVMVAPEDPAHPDARHGHGREELFARAGMEPAFLATITGPVDDRYPENEMVLAFILGEHNLAYPLREVQRESGVVREVVDGVPVVVLAGPDADGFAMGAFEARARDRDLTLVRENGVFRDQETGSRWTIEGRAVEGLLRGTELTPIPWSYVRWHAWTYVHRDARIYRSRRARPRHAPGAPLPAADPVEPILDALAAAGHEVRVGEPPVSQRRPREASASVTVYVDGDRIHLHVFDSHVAARDFDAFRGAWSTLPLIPKSGEGRTRRLGRVVLQSDPQERFLDPFNVALRPPAQIRWARALEGPELAPFEEGRAARSDPGEPGFLDVIRALRLAGFGVIDVGFLPPAQLRVGATNGIALTIDTDRFLLYRFADEEAARRYAGEAERAVAFGPYVLRSTPLTMYLDQGWEVLYVGDHTIRWSQLLEDQRFLNVLHGVAAGSSG